MICNKFFWTVILVLGFISLKSQEYSTRNLKAIKFYEQAESKYQIYEFDAAISLLKKAIGIDTSFYEVWLLMSDIYDYKDNSDSVIICSQNALKSGADKSPVTYFFISKAYYKTGKYQEAQKYSEIFLNKKLYTPAQKKTVDKIIIDCKFAEEALKHPVKFSPVNLGDNINTKNYEYWPSLSSDEEMLVFTRNIPINESNPNFFHNRQEDIYYSIFKENQWQKAVGIGAPLNSSDNEGAQFITSDGKQLYFTTCGRYDGVGKCDLYMSEKIGDKWSSPVNLGEPVNSVHNEKQPALSSDGMHLYFSSNRAGGKGGADIWMASKTTSGKWGKLVNLGDSINTSGDETSPFIHPDNSTFYFASDGWPGMGGSEIYISRKKTNGSWSKAQNMGYPINTYANEMGLIVNANGDKAYFSSNRIPEKGLDIYYFELEQKVRPMQVSYFKGKVYDAETKKPLEARFELLDIKTSKIINQAVSDEYTGEFLVCIPANQDYALSVAKQGYLFYSENFSLAGIDNSKPFLKDVPMQAMKAGNKVVLKNIFFETNSFELKPESTVELVKVLQFINENPNIKIEISGHTDNVGNDALNQKLSENRAKSVVDYFVSKGVSSARITSKGYGKTQPVADNKTEEGRAMNRRTEFKIIGF